MARPDGDRKLDIDARVLQQVETLAGLGLSVKNIAAALDISRPTFYRYKDENPEFMEAFERGIAKVRAVVAQALLKNCEQGDLASIKWFEMTRHGLSEKTESTSQHVFNVEPFEKYIARLRGVEYGSKSIEGQTENPSELLVDPVGVTSNSGGDVGKDGVSDE